MRRRNLRTRRPYRRAYQGIRPAPGYPAQPDHTEKERCSGFSMPRTQAGVSLTESYAMWPGSSVSGSILSHPEAYYFGVAKVERDQVEDYARRKGNPALVTYYFGSKDNLFQAVVEQVIGEWRSEILAVVPENANPEQALRLRARATMYFLRRYPYLTRLIIHQMMTVKSKESRFFIENFARVNFEEHRGILQKGIEEGAFRPVDPLFYFAHYIAMGDLYANLAPMMQRLGGKADDDDARFEAFVEAMIEMLIHGIGAKSKKSAKAR
jgi:AcrR family transcriptional regulator